MACATASSAAARPWLVAVAGDGRDLLQPGLRDARRLQPDVERQQAPACRQRRTDPRRREVAARTRTIDAADVDTEPAVRRLEPRSERRLRRRGAGVERVAGEDAGGRGTGRRARAAGDADEQGRRDGESDQPALHVGQDCEDLLGKGVRRVRAGRRRRRSRPPRGRRRARRRRDPRRRVRATRRPSAPRLSAVRLRRRSARRPARP